MPVTPSRWLIDRPSRLTAAGGVDGALGAALWLVLPTHGVIAGRSAS